MLKTIKLCFGNYDKMNGSCHYCEEYTQNLFEDCYKKTQEYYQKIQEEARQRAEMLKSLHIQYTSEMRPEWHGKWITDKFDGPYILFCSACDKGFEHKYLSNYCPNCGAKMENGNETN